MIVRVSEGVRVCMCAHAHVESNSSSTHTRGFAPHTTRTHNTHTHTHRTQTYARIHLLYPAKRMLGVRQQHWEMKSIISERQCRRKRRER